MNFTSGLTPATPGVTIQKEKYERRLKMYWTNNNVQLTKGYTILP